MTKEFEVPGIGKVILTKRRASRHMRLRVGHDGTARISLPYWAAYREALAFVAMKKEWVIAQQRLRGSRVLQDGMRVGKSHVLRFLPGQATRSRVTGNTIRIFYTSHPYANDAQAAAERAIIKVLKQQAAQLLPQRLAVLAHQHGCGYSGVRISRLKTRWGSCNSDRLITLNCFLIQLPWSLIDYVLLHELAHTKEMSHSFIFWNILQDFIPDVAQRRKELKQYHPHILTNMTM